MTQAITLTQLAYIVAVDKYRHFATAAEKCFVTQPTLSMQIKKLEQDLGVVLFDRSRQPVVPTELGTKVLEQARVVLSASRRIQEIINENRQRIAGSLRIGIIPTLAPYLLPMFIGDFLRKYTDIHVEVEELVSEEIINGLKEDVLDAGIFVTPFHDTGIEERPVFYEEILLYAHPDHPLLKKDMLEVADVATPEIWMLGDGHCFRDQVINLCAMQETQHQGLPFEFASNSLETLMKIVDREGGFTLIPELALQYMSEEKKRQVRRFSTYHPLREVSVIYSRHYTKQRLLELLWEEIRHVVPISMLDKERGKIVEWRTPKTNES